jgi:hypothetical protein
MNKLISFIIAIVMSVPAFAHNDATVSLPGSNGGTSSGSGSPGHRSPSLIAQQCLHLATRQVILRISACQIT